MSSEFVSAEFITGQVNHLRKYEKLNKISKSDTISELVAAVDDSVSSVGVDVGVRGVSSVDVSGVSSVGVSSINVSSINVGGVDVDVCVSDSEVENINDLDAELNVELDTIENVKFVDDLYIPTGNKFITITKSGAFIKLDMIKNNQKILKKIINYFTLSTELITGTRIYLKCHTNDKTNNRIIVPRFGIFEILNKRYLLKNYSTKMQISSGNLPSKPFIWKGRQTDNQKIIAEHIITNYYNDMKLFHGSAGVILNLEAGQGKSYLAAYLISKIQRKTVIILHTTALIEQWVKVLKNAFGESISIGFYYSKKKTDGDVVIQIIDSSANDMFRVNGHDYMALEYYNRFGFAIYDECHIYSNKTALKALKTAQTPYMLGLSATPDEHAAGFDKAVWWNIGPILKAADLDGYEVSSENFQAEVHKVVYYGPPSHTKLILMEDTGLINSASTINMLCDDDFRSIMIVEKIIESLKLNLYTFVFADRREYLLRLKKILKIMNNTNGEMLESDKDFMRIVGGAEASELEQAELKAKVVFTTYQYMGTGKSIIKMNGLVLATPRKSKMRQYINRIFRLGSDTTVKRHIWDICDAKVRLIGQWNTRKKYYNEKNYEITSTKVNHDDYVERVYDVIYKLNNMEAEAKAEANAKAEADAKEAKAKSAKIKSVKIKSKNAKNKTKSEVVDKSEVAKSEVDKSEVAMSEVDKSDTIKINESFKNRKKVNTEKINNVINNIMKKLKK